MKNQEFNFDLPLFSPENTGGASKKHKIVYDNYVSPYWYGHLIDSQSKIENLKNLYEAFRSGFISLEDFNQTITEMNDNRPIARSV